MKWFLGSFLLWLAYRGRLAKYIALATTSPSSATTGTQTPAVQPTVNNSAANAVSTISNSAAILNLLGGG